jgi:hypothetical protein
MGRREKRRRRTMSDGIKNFPRNNVRRGGFNLPNMEAELQAWTSSWLFIRARQKYVGDSLNNLRCNSFLDLSFSCLYKVFTPRDQKAQLLINKALNRQGLQQSTTTLMCLIMETHRRKTTLKHYREMQYHTKHLKKVVCGLMSSSSTN